MASGLTGTRLRRDLKIVVILNLSFFAIELFAAAVAGSVSLAADSADFLEDASLNLLVLTALRWTARVRARLGLALAALLLAPGLATLVLALTRLRAETLPAAGVTGLTGLGALGVNGLCAVLLARHRASGGSLTAAAFLSARNDVIANLAIIAVGALTAVVPSIWPDLVAGLGIGLLNAGAARAVFIAARRERGEARGAAAD